MVLFKLLKLILHLCCIITVGNGVVQPSSKYFYLFFYSSFNFLKLIATFLWHDVMFGNQILDQ